MQYGQTWDDCDTCYARVERNHGKQYSSIPFKKLAFFLANARTDLLLHLEQTYSSFICLPEVVMMQTGFILLLTMAVKYLNALLFPGLQFFIACSSSDQNLELGKAWEQD